MKQNSANLEYLEAIYILSQTTGNVRSVDIARYKNVSKPTVCVRMRKLMEKGFIEKSTRSSITLTGEGKAVASKANRNRALFRTLLESLGIENKNADELALLAAPVITRKTLDICSRYLGLSV